MTHEIEASINYSKRISDLFTNHDRFYQDLVPGQSIVHYHNGFNEFIRCEVVNKDGKNKLKPIAMVGAWKHDLPRRRYPNGEPVYCHHAEQIEKGELFEPNYTNIYEHNPSKFPIDPRQLSARDISLPAMTDEAAVLAAKWQKVDAIRAIISSERQNPDKILEQISLIVQGE
jgi:hypothetical protein